MRALYNTSTRDEKSKVKLFAHLPINHAHMFLTNIFGSLYSDCAGLVGNEGPTHRGWFELAYIACIPHMVVMAPSDETEVQNMMATAVAIHDAPSVADYPRRTGLDIDTINENFGSDFAEMTRKESWLAVCKSRIICNRHVSFM